MTSPASRHADVVCIGESMAVLVPEQHGPLEDVERFHRGVGGAESNVACALAALQVPAAWISRVGRDGFGRLLLAQLAERGVDTSGVELDPHRATGLYVKEIGGDTGSPHDLGPENSRLHYYRAGSAASALSPDSLTAPRAAELLAGARIIHVSGITAALGRLTGADGGLRLVRHVLTHRRPGQLVSFDLNWRPRLWHAPAGPTDPADPAGPAVLPEPSQATEILASLADQADIVLLGADEAVEVFGTADPFELRTLLPGPRIVVVKDADRAVTAFDRDEHDAAVTEPALRVEVVEPIGAGDAFAAGYLTGLLRGRDQRGRLRLGHVCAATALMVRADHGTPPNPETLEALLGCTPARWSGTLASRGVFSVPEDGTGTP